MDAAAHFPQVGQREGRDHATVPVAAPQNDDATGTGTLQGSHLDLPRVRAVSDVATSVRVTITSV